MFLLPFCVEVADNAEPQSETYNSDVLWLKANRRNPHTELEIFERMKKTMPGRRAFITGLSANNMPPTTTEVLETFPRFMDTDGLVCFY